MNNLKINSYTHQDTILIPQITLRDSSIQFDTSSLLLKIDTNKHFKNKDIKLFSHAGAAKEAQLKKILDMENYHFCDYSLIDAYNNKTGQSLNQNKFLYISKNEKVNKTSKITFLELNKSLEKKSFNPGERAASNLDWYIFPFLGGVILLAFVLTAYRRYIGLFYESIFFRFVSKKILNDKNVTLLRFSLLLDLLFIISFSLFVNQIIIKLLHFNPSAGTNYLIALFVSFFLIFLKVIRFILIKVLVVFTKQSLFFNDLNINSLIYTRVLGIILLPMVFLIQYTTTSISILLLFISILATIIMLIYRTIRTIKVFMDNGFSIFYFILYLCALELVPLLVIWKEVQTRLY